VDLIILCKETRDAHSFGDDNIHPTWYKGEPVSDRHEARAERVHGRRTRARYTQCDEHREELTETAQGGQDTV
jgi:hypothetical protein